uniref:GST C-terminal domain-containing protein n=1 Tax=Noctiluca scintillans TaxID=2966 RepID=A0A7S1F4L3_NOCSC
MAQVAESGWKFMTAWFCPYAQRAWIALNHHRVPYERIEALTLKLEPGQTITDATGYIKHPLLLKHNPGALVPTIVDSEEKQPAVYDSLVVVEFADDLASTGAVLGSSPLLPSDPTQRARARLWADWANKNVCSPFYTVLVPKELDRRREGFTKLREGLLEFQKNIRGPFFLGEHLSVVDIAVIPWIHRIFTCRVIETYRGQDFMLDTVEFAPLLKWWESCVALDCVALTLADQQDLTDTYKRYADGTAESKVGAAVRAGRAADAHD